MVTHFLRLAGVAPRLFLTWNNQFSFRSDRAHQYHGIPNGPLQYFRKKGIELVAEKPDEIVRFPITEITLSKQ